jgi:glycosyltransferase involved in cell wall biosynthesis
MKEMTAKDSLVSVIVPTYNRAHLIVFTLDSVFRQTYRPIEVLIVDDGSHDKTEEVVRDWAAQQCVGDERFSLQYVRQDNAGPSAARNTGFRRCSGVFVQFLDSDDMLHPEKLARQVVALQQNREDFCVCNYQVFTDGAVPRGPVIDFYRRSHHIEEFPAQYPMDTPAPLYRREAILAAGPWDESMRAGEDFEYNFRLVARGARGVWVDEVLLYVRRHEAPERIQATPLAGRYQSMALGLMKMEMEAVARGICSKRLLNSLGIRAYQYYRHTRAEGSLAEAGVFFRYARPRLFWRTKANLWLRQVLPAPMARLCVPIKRLTCGAGR